MKLIAKAIPWSSVVGTGVMLLDEKGLCIGMLGLNNVMLEGPAKEVSMKLIEQVTEKINAN